jgi:nucleotide-binding universal stress UspA family protein
LDREEALDVTRQTVNDRFNIGYIARRRQIMQLFQTIIHPTDFDEPSMEAFRVARHLACTLGARVIVFHVVPPPAVVTQDGQVAHDPKIGEPVDLWSEYRRLQADTPEVRVEYAVAVGDKEGAKHTLQEKIRQFGEGVLVVMGSHGRKGLSRLLWGSKAEEVVRELPCPVLVVKSPPAIAPLAIPTAEATVTA